MGRIWGGREAGNVDIESDNKPSILDYNITTVVGENPTFTCIEVEHSYAAPTATKPGIQSGIDLQTVHCRTIKQEDSPYIPDVPDEEPTLPCLDVKQSYPAPIATDSSIQNENDLPTVPCKTLKKEDRSYHCAVCGKCFIQLWKEMV